MKKSWLRSSIGLLLVMTVGLSFMTCKVKKAAKEQKLSKTDQVVKRDTIESAIKQEEIVIHKPGLINPKQLDSLKAIKKRQKRNSIK